MNMNNNRKGSRNHDSIRSQSSSHIQSRSGKSVFRARFFPGAALVAGLLVVVFLFSPWFKSNQDIVSAMEQTVKQIQNYHGTLEKISRNAASEEQLQSRTEIWSEGSHYATRNEEGVLTVNNGESRWMTQPQSQEVTLLPVYLDPHDFDLRREADKALRYPHRIMGEETVAGRTATRLEITPPGGLPYYLWIDSQTFLPIRLQTAMQKSLQTTYTFVNLETNIAIPAVTFAYAPPAGYHIIDQNPDKLVGSLTEGIAVSGLSPLQPTGSHNGFLLPPIAWSWILRIPRLFRPRPLPPSPSTPLPPWAKLPAEHWRFSPTVCAGSKTAWRLTSRDNAMRSWLNS